MKQELMDLLIENSLKVSDHEEFLLASGKRSRYYIDCKATLLHPKGLSLVGRVMWDFVKEKAPDLVGGMTLGSDPITMSTVIAAENDGVEVFPLIVRKEAKSHGTQKWVEGTFKEGMKIVVFDDVFTTGGSTLKAIEKLQEAGVEVIEAIAMIDREEGSEENFAKKAIKHRALFKISELLDAADSKK